MPEPRRISFPVLRDPYSGQECLIIYHRVILDARGPAYQPQNCYVIGLGADGHHYKFSVRVGEYEAAARAPANFIQVDNMQAPSATLVDVAGQPFSPPGGWS